MELHALRGLLESFANQEVSIDEALSRLKQMPFTDIGDTKLDTHRSIRKGMPEVIYCAGKTTDQVKSIIREQLSQDETVFGTRAPESMRKELATTFEELSFDDSARCFWQRSSQWHKKTNTQGTIAIVTGGTADIPVAREAQRTVEILGHPCEFIPDIGVAGLHRLLASMPVLHEARVIIAVAGMEGALPSVVAGMVSCPVIGVPTDVGYGSHLNGLVPLFAMLNSCASGLTVVNVNNGFGAGIAAVSMNRRPDVPDQ